MRCGWGQWSDGARVKHGRWLLVRPERPLLQVLHTSVGLKCWSGKNSAPALCGTHPTSVFKIGKRIALTLIANFSVIGWG